MTESAFSGAPGVAERKSVEDDLSYRSSAAFTSNDTPPSASLTASSIR
jgi:hypothetical protein